MNSQTLETKGMYVKAINLRLFTGNSKCILGSPAGNNGGTHVTQHDDNSHRQRERSALPNETN